MAEQQKYLKLEIVLDTIYIREEVYGIVIKEEKLNSITKSTYINFFQFFNDRFKSYPLVLKNDNKYLTIVKTLLEGSGPIKGGISKLPNNYIMLDMTDAIASKSYQLTENGKIIPDIRTIFANIK